MMEICGDNRFEIIAKAKEHLLDATNIDTSEDEMKVLDSFLFRCWQMGWLDKYDDRKTESNSEKPNNCECEPRKEQNFCGKCRYLYRDFKYGLSCYRLMDNEPCKYEERKDEPTISKMEQVDKDINVRCKDETKISCDGCRNFTDGGELCDLCALGEIDNYEPQEREGE